MAVIAKGARTGRLRFGSTLEPMSHIQAVIHCKPGRDLQILSETSHIHTHEMLRHSLERIESGLRVVELTASLMETQQVQSDLFSLLVSTLTALENSPGRIGNIWPFFQLRFASILGFGPSFNRAAVESVVAAEGILDLKTGAIQPTASSGQFPALASRAALRAFSVLSRAHLSDVVRMEMNESLQGEVGNLVTSYLKFHVDNAYPSRAAKVFAELQKATTS